MDPSECFYHLSHENPVSLLIKNLSVSYGSRIYLILSFMLGLCIFMCVRLSGEGEGGEG